jgi:hypothetical protein|tara:strand:- start:395 stop:745 length:351 start_codon:yes stop_codon:yes gene_type:complete
MNNKLMIAETILKKLNSEIKMYSSKPMSERQFSRNWLKKSPNYMSVIKAGNTDISVDALFNLFGTIISKRMNVDVHTSTDKGIDINNKKAKFFLNLEYWLSDQIYTQAAEKQELKV